MNARDILSALIEHPIDGTITLEPGPFKVAVNDIDVKAGEIIIWMSDKYPTLTLGQMENVLLSAMWWIVTFATVKKAEQHMPHEAKEPSA